LTYSRIVLPLAAVTRTLGVLTFVRPPAAEGEMSTGDCGASGAVVSSTNDKLATADRLPNSSAAVKRIVCVPSFSGPPLSESIAVGGNVKLSPLSDVTMLDSGKPSILALSAVI